MLKIQFVCLSYLLFLTVYSQADVVQCKPDYWFDHKACGWFKLHLNPASWEAAFLTCHHEGAVLASPLNKHIANALRSLMSQFNLNRHIYLGTSDLHSKDVYASVEGIPLSDLEIRWSNEAGIGAWVTTPMDSSSQFVNLAQSHVKIQDCLTMTINGRSYYMHKSTCDQELPFICYKKLTNETLNECGTFDNEYHLNQKTGSCYKLHKQKQTWSSAYKTCASEGAYLVIVNDKAEANVLHSMFLPSPDNANSSERFHIGLRAWGPDHTWITIHGERLQDVFHVWQQELPDYQRSTQGRGNFLRTTNMDEISAEQPARFVCEKNPKSIRYETLPYSRSEGLYKYCDICNESL